MTSPSSDAWLLHMNGDLRAAIGLREMLYVLPEAGTTFSVPRTNPHAAHVLMWQQRLVPVIDLEVYLHGAQSSQAAGMIGIVSCIADGDESALPRFGALKMSRPPERIQVSDEQACGLPPGSTPWHSIAASCFHHPIHGAVPILDLAAILSRP